MKEKKTDGGSFLICGRISGNFFASVLLCLAWFFFVPVAAGEMPTAEDVGIPKRFQHLVGGYRVLQPGEIKRAGLDRYPSQEGLTAGKVGKITFVDDVECEIVGPVKIVEQGSDTITIKAVSSGQGYIMLKRRFGYFEKDDGPFKVGYLFSLDILVVNETAAGGFIKGRAVMRGMDDGVGNALVQLIGKKSGLNSSTDTTGPDGSFDFVIKDFLPGDRYEVFVRKGSANVAKTDSVQEDLWPINKYYVSINNENCKNLDVGRIEMAAIGDLWGDSVPANRREVDVTPQPSQPVNDPQTQGLPGQNSNNAFPWKDIESGAIRIFRVDNVWNQDDDAGQDSADSPDAARSMQIQYKGYAEVDFHLKASMSLDLRGDNVTGELYAPAVHGQNVRLPGARMQLEGKLSEGWEEDGRIDGTCTGNILWPGGQPEARDGQIYNE